MPAISAAGLEPAKELATRRTLMTHCPLIYSESLPRLCTLTLQADTSGCLGYSQAVTRDSVARRNNTPHKKRKKALLIWVMPT